MQNLTNEGNYTIGLCPNQKTACVNRIPQYSSSNQYIVGAGKIYPSQSDCPAGQTAYGMKDKNGSPGFFLGFCGSPNLTPSQLQNAGQQNWQALQNSVVLNSTCGYEGGTCQYSSPAVPNVVGWSIARTVVPSPYLGN